MKRPQGYGENTDKGITPKNFISDTFFFKV